MCPNCGMQAVENIGHFATVCPKFKDIRSARVAHDSDDAWETVTVAASSKWWGPRHCGSSSGVSSSPGRSFLRSVTQRLPAPSPLWTKEESSLPGSSQTA